MRPCVQSGPDRWRVARSRLRVASQVHTTFNWAGRLLGWRCAISKRRFRIERSRESHVGIGARSIWLPHEDDTSSFPLQYQEPVPRQKQFLPPTVTPRCRELFNDNAQLLSHASSSSSNMVWRCRPWQRRRDCLTARARRQDRVAWRKDGKCGAWPSAAFTLSYLPSIRGSGVWRHSVIAWIWVPPLRTTSFNLHFEIVR